MHYLKAVIKETIRLHPMLFVRESIQDMKIQGYDIAVGTKVYINAWAIGGEPVSWDEPEEFKPERFLTSSIDFRGHDFQLIPFGAGRRVCPGMAFAITTMEIVLTSLMHKFNWTLPGCARAEDLDITESFSLTINRNFPLIAIATQYSS